LTNSKFVDKIMNILLLDTINGPLYNNKKYKFSKDISTLLMSRKSQDRLE